MQHLTLHPGLLTFRGEDWGTAGPPVVYDEHHQTLHCGRRFVRLSPLEYALVMALLRQRERFQAAPSHAAFCVTVKRLCHISGSESERSIRRTLTEARQKVEGLGLRIIRLYGENRYCVLFASEVEGEDEDEAADPRVVRSSEPHGSSQGGTGGSEAGTGGSHLGMHVEVGVSMMGVKTARAAR